MEEQTEKMVVEEKKQYSAPKIEAVELNLAGLTESVAPTPTWIDC